MKHVVTSLAARVPEQGHGTVHLILPSSSSLPGLRSPGGVEHRLDPSLERRAATGSLSARNGRCLSRPMPCSPETCPPVATPAANSSSRSAVRRSRVGQVHRQVDVAVADVAAPRDERPVGVGERGDGGEVVRDRGARHDDVDDLVGAGGLGHVEGALPRLDERALAEVDGSTKTSRAPRSPSSVAAATRCPPRARPRCASRGATMSHAAAFAVTSSDTPNSSDAAREMPTIVTASRYSRIDGESPAASSLGTAPVTASSVGERRRAAWRTVPRAGERLKRHLGHEGERALRADDQLGEVVARGGLHDLAAGAHDGRVGQHELEARGRGGA